MAKIALERSKRPEIISLANGIIEAQERENRDMRSWYELWFGSAPPQDGMGMMHMGGMEGDTAELKNVSTAQFDREFMEQMIPHHEMSPAEDREPPREGVSRRRREGVHRRSRGRRDRPLPQHCG